MNRRINQRLSPFPVLAREDIGLAIVGMCALCLLRRPPPEAPGEFVEGKDQEVQEEPWPESLSEVRQLGLYQ